MTRSPHAAFLLGLLVALAGCMVDPDSAGSPQPPPSHEGTQALPIDADISTPGTVFADSLACGVPDLSNPAGACERSASVNLYVTGNWNGIIVDMIHVRTTPDGSFTGGGTQVFTGSIAGCGSGTLTFTYTGFAGDPDPDHPGDILGVDNLTLVRGSATTGFAGIADVQALENYHINPVTFAGAGSITGTVWCRTDAVPDLTGDREGAQELPLHGSFTGDGTGVDQLPCNPMQPGVCELYATLFLDLKGTMTGQVTDVFHFHHDGSPTPTLDAGAVRFFTGSIDGCGSGSLALQLADRATVDLNPSPSTFLHLKEPLQTLVQGSTTNGLAGIVDAHVTFEFNMTATAVIRDGTVTGSVWCRSPPSVSTDHEGAREVVVQDTLVSAGFLVPDYTMCDPLHPGVCEIYATQLLVLTGTMPGTMVDQYHLHFLADGSIVAVAYRTFTGSVDGCGSGTLTLLLQGTVPPVEPSLTHPGFLHLQEIPMTLVPGTTTLGFPDVVDIAVTAEGDFYGAAAVADGTVTGTVWCR